MQICDICDIYIYMHLQKYIYVRGPALYIEIKYINIKIYTSIYWTLMGKKPPRSFHCKA